MKKTISLLLLAFTAAIFSGHVSALAAHRIASGKNGMVVSVDRYASQVGIEILKRGGNAVDAALAVGFALAVTYPAAGNIGGGGFMVIRIPDQDAAVALDFREMAPGRASSDMYLDDEGKYVEDRSLYGYLAVGVPGTVRGFELALKKYGTLPWRELIAPAIKLAKDGFRLTKARADSFNRLKKKKFKGNAEFFRIFSKPDGTAFKEGDLFIQKDLARTLKLIAGQGPGAFYTGKIARAIALDMKKQGGLIDEQDLARYEAKLRNPVVSSYRGYDIISMPLPSSGGTILIEMLNILEGFELEKMERFAAPMLHLVAEAMKFAYLDRARHLGDPDFIQAPVERLLSKDYARQVRERIDPARAIPSSVLGAEILTIEKSRETTHFSIIDKQGMAVATTYTLNGGFGAGVVAEGTGILLNNEMADFNLKPEYTDDQGLIGTQPNLIAPRKRMLSSMTPTIVAMESKTLLITGSPGGRTIINTLLNVIINILDFKMSPQEAVDAPRLDHEWMPDILRVEKGISDEVIRKLERLGHKVKKIARQGDAHTIYIDPDTGIYYGAADRRAEGSAVGY